MHCFVYASDRKVDTYLWLAERDDFGLLPESLTLLLGNLRFVLEVTLDPERRLPKEDTRTVLENLHAQGWHLQLPAQETLAVPNRPPVLNTPTDTGDPRSAAPRS